MAAGTGSVMTGQYPSQAAQPNAAASPATALVARNVSFELLFPDSPQYKARLPLRVSIYPHDTTESIITTVKNFYGLYSGPTVSKGVSFEDGHGNTLIARYENFRNNMVVYVRVFEEASSTAEALGPQPYQSPPTTVPVQPLYTSEALPLLPLHQTEQRISRPDSRTSRKRSVSPLAGLNDHRSNSAGATSAMPKKSRSRSSKGRGTGSFTNGDIHSDSHNGYSSGDGAPDSTSGKGKDHLGNTEISVDNILEGGRRKRAKFESSELPLFAPPQMPAATSNPSVSPARRSDHHRHSLPSVAHGQNPFMNPRPLQSPQTYTPSYGRSSLYATPAADFGRARGAMGYTSGIGNGAGIGILPTPDPTVGSTMSEEDKDVAMQLMRLGEMSNMSHGRTSASTLDEAFSGKAEAASSNGASSDADSDSDAEMQPARKLRLDAAGNSRKIFQTTESHFVAPGESGQPSGDEADSELGFVDGSMAAPKLQKVIPDGMYPSKQRPKTARSSAKVSRPAGPKMMKKPPMFPGPMSPASLPASRKPSVVSNTGPSGLVGEEDQPDLSSKPRCQRCRKSKKGCDRQRPCGRCRDAGIPAELCVSEDEGNGRKGRYGRHMGVPIAKEDGVAPMPALLPAAPIGPAFDFGDKNKKRKR